MKPEAELRKIVGQLPAIKVGGTFARRVPLAALFGLTSAPTAATVPRIPEFLFASDRPYRYSRRGTEALYLGEGESAAAAEAKQHPGALGFDRAPTTPDSIFHVEVALDRVLDLTDATVCASVGTTEAALLAPWRLLSPDAPTQLLGQVIFDSNQFEGIRYRSAPAAAAGANAHCLVIFRRRKSIGSIVRIYDPAGIWSETW